MTFITTQTSTQAPSAISASSDTGSHRLNPLAATHPQGRPLPIPTREEFHRFFAGVIRSDDFYTSSPATGNAARVLGEQKRYSKYIKRHQATRSCLPGYHAGNFDREGNL